jgi:hypothetical protein
VDLGWGIDELLGEQTRQREDLDLVVTSAELDRVRVRWSEFEYRADPPELPPAFVPIGT